MKKAKGYAMGGGTPLANVPRSGGMSAPSSQLSSMGNAIGGVGAPRSAGSMGGSPMGGPLSQSASMGATGAVPMGMMPYGPGQAPTAMSAGMNRFRGTGPAAAGPGMMPGGGGLTMMAKGGHVESKKMVKKEVAFMKKKGAPKSMIKHEEAEAKGMKRGGMACGGMKKYAEGGAIKKPKPPTSPSANEKSAGDQEMQMREDIAAKNRMRGPGRGPLSRNGMRDKPFGYAKGGGIESHGKTKGTMIKMASGGSVSARADGVAQRGKTNCKIC